MANRFYLPIVEVQDSSGGVEAGAKLQFYENTTTTPLDTYTTDTLAVANANPVIANSSGRFGSIFLKDQDYTVVLSTSADVQVWSEDNVRGQSANLIDDTIGSTLSTTGSANAYALTVNRVITAYANGDKFVCKANFQNTGACTFNVTGGQSGASALGAKSIKTRHDQDPASGDIENGQWLVLKYDGTNMQLLTPVASAGYSDPITTRGDIIRGDSSGNVERLALGAAKTVMHSDGTDAAWAALVVADLPAGVVIQTVNVQDGAVATGTTQMPFDDTIPQNTEGDEFMTLAITPTNTNSTLYIDVLAHCGITADNHLTMGLFQDSTAAALAAMTRRANAGATDHFPLPLRHKMTAGTTSSTTFKVRIGPGTAATTTFNGNNSGREAGGVIASSITIWEIAP